MAVTLKLLDRSDESGRPLWRLLDHYQYEIGPGSIIIVPAGYVTNLGSVPRFASWIVTPSQMREPAIVHDWMCNEKFTDGPEEYYSGYSRWMADAVLYEALERIGFSWPRRFAIFVAVRIWAWLRGQGRWSQRPVPELNVIESEQAS